MPGRNQPTRAQLAEDLECKVTEAGQLAGGIAAEIDNGANPKDLVAAWGQVSTELMNLATRIRKLAR